MADFTEELEPLFDYRRVQPMNFVCVDDDDSDSSPAPLKRRKTSNSVVEDKVGTKPIVTEVVDCDDKEEEDWLPPPPKASSVSENKFGEDSTIKQLRLKKQELASFAESAKKALKAVEESVKRDFGKAKNTESLDNQVRESQERPKVVISVQDKDGLKQYRVFKDDKFERLFKMYSDRLKLDVERLVFCFDGEKINPADTPEGLGMEDDDMIEVHVKSS